MSRAAWQRDLAELAGEFGCTPEIARSGHVRLRHPSGWSVSTSSTPGDRRALANLRSDLRRKRAGIWR